MIHINPTLDRLAMALTETGARTAMRIIFQMPPEDELLGSYRLTEGRVGEAIANLLLAQIQRRELFR